MVDDHSFSCDVDFDNGDPVVATLFEKKLNYTIDVFSLDDGERAFKTVTTNHGNSMLIGKEFWKPD